MRSCYTLLVLLLFSAPALAQNPFETIAIPNGPVNSIAVIEDTLYFGGDFDLVGPDVGPATALDPATGDVIPGVIPRVVLDQLTLRPRLSVVVSDGDGGVYLAGEFESVGGVPRINLARILADGTVDPDFAPDPQIPAAPFSDGRITRVELHEGVLFIGGDFSFVAGGERDDFAALDAETGALLDFNPVIGEPGDENTGSISRAILRDGIVTVSGGFSIIDGAERQYLAAFDFETGDLLPWNPTFDSFPGRMVYDGEDGVYFIGNFDAVEGEPRDGLAYLALPGPDDTSATLFPWAPEFSLADTTFSYAFPTDVVLTDDALWLSGDFVETGQIGDPNRIITPLIRFSRADDAMSAEAALFDINLRDGQAVATDGESVWVSAADNADDIAYLLAVDAETLAPTDFEVITGVLTTSNSSPPVNAMAHVDGRLIVAGRELGLGGVFAPFYGSVNLTTGETMEGTSEPFEESILWLMPFPDGRRMYVKEFFGQYIEIDLVTGERTSFGVPYGEGEAVRDASEAPALGDSVYTARLSGEHLATLDRLYLRSASGPNGRTRLRAVDPQTLAPIEGFEFELPILPDEVLDLHLADGWLYISGRFGGGPFGGSEYRNFIRVDPDTGEPDPSWIAYQGGGGAQYGGPMAFAEDRFVLGGINFSVGETSGLAAYDRPEGNLITSWEGSIDLGAPTLDEVLYADSVFYVVGDIVEANGEERDGVAAFGYNGELLDWPPVEVNGLILPSARHDRVYVAGEREVATRSGDHVQGGGSYVIGSVPAARNTFTPVAEEPSVPTSIGSGITAFYPNPFSDRATVALTLQRDERVRVEVYDVLGRRVMVVHDGAMAAGESRFSVPAQSLAPGLYIVRATGESFTATGSATLVR